MSASRRARTVRRDRRKAKQTGFKRQPKGLKVGHGTSLTDTITAMKNQNRIPEPSRPGSLSLDVAVCKAIGWKYRIEEGECISGRPRKRQGVFRPSASRQQALDALFQLKVGWTSQRTDDSMFVCWIHDSEDPQDYTWVEAESFPEAVSKAIRKSYQRKTA